jgi:hypothetical protein
MEGDLSEHVVIVKTAVGQNHLHDALQIFTTPGG